MSKFRKDLRVGVLGAVAGLFSVSLFLLVARVDFYYEYLTWIESSGYQNYGGRVDSLWWIPVLLGQMSISVLVSLAAHRYFAARSPFLLWQAIGVGSLLGWLGLIFVALGLDLLMQGNINSAEHAIRMSDASLVAKYVAAVFACHVCYGSLINAAVREYAD